MASTTKRTTAKGTTTYIVKWRTPDGKHRTKGGFTSKKAAEAYGTKAEAAKLAGTAFDPAAGKVLFRDVAAKWLAHRHDLKATTHAAYAEALAPTTEATAKRHKKLAQLRIDAVFGGYPVSAIKSQQITEWIQRLVAAGKGRTTIRNAVFLVRQVLRFAVVEGYLAVNPAADVKLPATTAVGHNTSHGVVDDPAQFLTAAQVQALVAATPWPYNVMVHVAAWSGLRAAELAGLCVGDVDLPAKPMNPNMPAKPGSLRVERTVRPLNGELTYLTPKTKGSVRRVPLTPQTTGMLRGYLAEHPRGGDPTAPLWPAVRLAADPANRLALDWAHPYRHATVYKAVYKPAVVAANATATAAGATAPVLPAGLTFHALRHTYASLCVAAGLDYLAVCRFMGHSKPTTTLAIYTHLFSTDDHAGAMAALGAMATGAIAPPSGYGNVLPFAR